MKNQKELIKRMESLQVLIPDTIKAIEDLPEIKNCHLYTMLDPGRLQIRFPYDENYLRIRRLTAKCWRYISHGFNEYTGNWYVYFHHRTLQITLSFELDIPIEFQEGLSCRLVEVGHKTEVIYGLECK
jgi:hypothetical protein